MNERNTPVGADLGRGSTVPLEEAPHPGHPRVRPLVCAPI